MEENKSKISFWKGALCGALVAFLIMIASVIGLRFLNGSGVSVTGESEEFLKLNRLKTLIEKNFLYSDDVTEETMTEGIYKGLVESLGDPYTVYYDKEETKQLYESTSGEYSGIGVVFTQNMDTKVSTAIRVYSGSPAEEAGIQEGDIIYKVDGELVSQMELSQVVKMIRGEEGTNVQLTVLRGEEQKEVTVDVTRRKIQVETVTSEMKEGQIGYIRVTEFDSVTYEQFQAQLENLESQGMKGLVVDLRSNPGGNLKIVCDMLDLLLPKGLIVYTKDKNGNKQEITSDNDHQFTKPLAVLVDGNSASAAEIFAGAIQDYGMGPIVGTTTFGKGIVQQIIDLGDGTCLKVTISEYFTPNGRNIHKKGIEPDVEVEYEKDENNPDYDNQLEKALEEVQKKIS